MYDIIRRVDYLNQTLTSLAGLQGLQKMALYVSQDGNDALVAALIESAFKGILHQKARRMEHWSRTRLPSISESQVSQLKLLSSLS